MAASAAQLRGRRAAQEPRAPLPPIAARTRALLCLAWMLPVGIIPVATLWLSIALERLFPFGTTVHVMLGWVSFGWNRYTFPSVIVVALACYAAVFVIWRRVERKREPKRAAGRAMVRTVVIAAIHAVSYPAIGIVALVVGNTVGAAIR